MDEIDGLCRRRSGEEAEWSRRYELLESLFFMIALLKLFNK